MQMLIRSEKKSSHSLSTATADIDRWKSKTKTYIKHSSFLIMPLHLGLFRTSAVRFEKCAGNITADAGCYPSKCEMAIWSGLLVQNRHLLEDGWAAHCPCRTGPHATPARWCSVTTKRGLFITSTFGYFRHVIWPRRLQIALHNADAKKTQGTTQYHWATFLFKTLQCL